MIRARARRPLAALLLALLLAPAASGVSLTGTEITASYVGVTDGNSIYLGTDGDARLWYDATANRTAYAGPAWDLGGAALEDTDPKGGYDKIVYRLADVYYARTAAGALLASGTTFDTVINAALLDGGRVFLPAGTYIKSGSTYVWIRTSGTELLGVPGATIIESNASTADSVVRASTHGPSTQGGNIHNVTIYGLTIRQSVRAGDGITVDDAENVRVLRNVVDGTGEEGIALYDVDRAVVADNFVRAAGSLASASTASLQCLACVDVEFTRNFINGDGTNTGTAGLEMKRGAGSRDSLRNVFSYNHVLNSRGVGIYVGYGVRNSTLDGNLVFNSATDGVRLDLASGAAYASTQNVVRDNRIEKSGAYGVNLQHHYTTLEGNRINGTVLEGLRLYQRDYLVVRGNDIEGAGEDCIEANKVGYSLILGNVVRSCQKHGFAIVNGAHSNTISENRVTRAGLAAANTYDGFSVQKSGGTVPTSNLLLGNYVVNCASCRNGIRFADADTNRVVANVVSGTTSAAIIATGTSAGNVYLDNLGFADRARGAATIPSGASSVTVTHGLGGTGNNVAPAAVGLAGAHAETAQAYATSLTTTTFTITVPAAVTADRVVYWTAEV